MESHPVLVCANPGAQGLEGRVAEPVVRFSQDLADFKKCEIFDSSGMVKEVEPEDCVGIERASMWEAHHVEARLLDHFMGRANQAEAHESVRLE